MGDVYVNDILKFLLARRSTALPEWIRAAVEDGQILPCGDGIRVGDIIARPGDMICQSDSGFFVTPSG